MAEYQNPEQNYDPAGSTQMFRAFVDEGTPASSSRQQPAAPEAAGSRTGLIVGIVVAVLVIAVAAYVALA